MFRTIFGSRRPAARPPIVPPPRRQRVLAHRSLVCSFLLTLLLLLSQVLGNWGFLVKPAEAASMGVRPSAPASMTFQQYLKEGQQSKAYHGPLIPPAQKQTATGPTTNYASLPPSAEPATMKPITQALSTAFLSGGAGASALDLKGSDGRLEALIPPGALDVSHATVANGSAPTGALSLELAQVHGHYVSQMSVLGSYEFQVLDSSGQVLNGVKLHSPVTLIYHYQQSEMDALDIDPAHVYLTWPSLIAAALQAKQPTTGLTLALQNDPFTHTLTTQTSVLGPHPFDMQGEPQNQSPPTLHLASVQGNSGQLAYSYPLQVPPGAGGFAPQLVMTYTSSSPNQRHARTSPAGDVGDGWSLSLGAITEETYAPNNTMWYFINDVAGVGDRLISTGNNLFDTQHISYLKIQQINPGSNGTCFHVWDKSGTYYELGCTGDSLQYWTDGNGVQHDYQWDVDKIIAPNEGPNAGTYRLIKLYYYQDTTSVNNHTSVRDSTLEQIIYGAGTTNSVTSVAGTVDFFYHGPNAYSHQSNDSSVNQAWVTAYGNNYNCGPTPPVTGTSLRCDDPIQYGTIQPPAVMSTLTLDKVASYVGSDAGSPAYSYAFSYTNTPFATNSTGGSPGGPCYDPVSRTEQYCAGEHLLTSVTPTVYQGSTGTGQPGVTFGYTGPLTNTYYDSLANHVEQGTTIQYNVQTYWQYLNFYEDDKTGVGGKVTWMIAYNNTHGTPNDTNTNGTVDDRYDPLHCAIWNDCTGTYAHPDDNAWSEYVVTTITALGTDSSSSSFAPAVTTYNYQLVKTGTHQTGSPFCNPAGNDSDCVGDNWLPPNDSDWQDYDHQEYEGFGQVLITSPAGDLTVQKYNSTAGWLTVWSATAPFTGGSTNFLGGSMTEEDVYSGNSASSNAHLLRTVSNTYATSPNACRSSTATYTACETVLQSTTTSDYELTGSSSPPAVTDTYTYDDYSTSGLAAVGSHKYHLLTQQVISGTNLPATSPKVYPLTEQWGYTTHDEVTNTNPPWTYYTVDTATHRELDDANKHVWKCQNSTYDENSGNTTSPDAGWPTTVTAYGSCANQSTTAINTYQAYDVYGHAVATVDGAAAATPPLYNTQGCSVSSGTIVASSSGWTKSTYTNCTAYDSTSSFALPTSTTNAFVQTTTYGYDSTQGNVLTSTTDPNSQKTSYAYSYTTSTATTQVSEPGETNSYTTRSTSSSSCTTSSTLPCFEIDNNAFLYNSVHTSTFYDSLGRAVETRTPGPGSSYDTVVFTTYNDQLHTSLQSVPFQVAHGTGWIDPNGAKDYQGVVPGGTVTFYDALNRPIATQDPQINKGSDGIACSATLTSTYTACVNYSLGTAQGDSNTYLTATTVDPNKHVSVAYADVLGRTVYTQQDSGIYGGTLVLVQQTASVYNAINKPTSITVTDEAPQSGQTITSVTTTASYDDLGRLTQLVDPDRGTHNYTYDANGNLIQDSSGTLTLGYAYDLLNRLGCVQDEPSQFSDAGACGTSSNGGNYNAFVQNTYDADPTGVSWNGTNYAKGRLTQSFAINYFPGPDYTQGKVTENRQYDVRGRVLTQRLQLTATGGTLTFPTFPTFQQALTYNDADQPVTSTTTTTPAGQGFTFTNAYDSTGALSGLSDTTSTTPDLATLLYNARAQLDTINFQTSTGGALAALQFGYDANLRTTSATATWGANSGTSGTLFSQGRSYDPASNVTSLSTTQAVVPGTTNSGGSETEAFCYDEQNRLVWAGNSGTPPAAGNGTCGSGPSNSLAGATYSSSYVYTHLGQLWQGPLNGGSTQEQYLYCASNTHQLIGLYPTTSGATCANYSTKSADYSSSYDAWGNVSSRAITNGTTLLTYPLSYDGLDHLVRWNDTHTTSNEEWYMYDGAGQRVIRRSQTGTGTSNTKYTVYAFGVQDDVYDGSGASYSDKYYYRLAGRLIGELNGGKTKFLLTDLLGSVVASLSNTANSAAVLGNQVYGPYGNNSYSKGAITTPKGYTGQYNDALTQLDYYNARYYDPAVGVFLSADSTQGNIQGMNPYAYVDGNPETKSDPSGLRPISACPTGGCNAPVDMGALTAAIVLWALGGGNALQPFSPFALNHTVGKTSPSNGDLGGGLTSCGSPGPSQPSCGILPALFAVYSSTGGAIGVPGPWCFWCGSGGGANDSGESGSGNDLTNESASSSADAQTLLNDPYAIQEEEAQLKFEHPDIQAAYASTLAHLEQVGGKPLSADLVETTVRLDPQDEGIKGFINGFAERNGERRWRLDFDENPAKGLHFNWEDFTLGKKNTGLGRWGVETFPGTYEDYIDLLLLLNVGGVVAMLGG